MKTKPCLLWLGVIEVGDVVDNKFEQLLGLDDTKILLYIQPNHDKDVFLWKHIKPWVNQCLKSSTRLLVVSANLLYHHSMASLSWLSSNVEKEWNVGKFNARWRKMLKRSWHFRLSFNQRCSFGGDDWGASFSFNTPEARVGIRHMLLLYRSIGRKYTLIHSVLRCTCYLELLTKNWQVLASYMMPKQRGFSQYVQSGPKDEIETML